MGSCTSAEGKMMKVLERIKDTGRASRYLNFAKRNRASEKIALIQIEKQENYSRWIEPFLDRIQQWGRTVQELHIVCPQEMQETIDKICGSYGKSVQYCVKDSGSYERLLCRAGWIILDGVFPENYIKKKKQHCVWVGGVPAPPEKNSLGNVQRSLLLCDYIVTDNKEGGKRILSDYYLDQLYSGRLLLDEQGDKWWTNIFGTSKICGEFGIERNGKENVLIYPGVLGENGITRSFYNLLSSIDLNKRNYYICFREKYMTERIDEIEKLPEEIGIIGWPGDTPMTVFETIAYLLRFKMKIAPRILDKVMDRIYIRESGRRFQRLPVDACIQFSGYEKEMIRIFRYFKGFRIIYAHNDMVAEVKKKGNQDWWVLRDAYQNYDKVAVVSEGVIAPVIEISGRRDNVGLVLNCQNVQAVLDKAESAIYLDEWTECNVSLEKLEEILEGPGEKFLNVGRYSPEKGHFQLVEAFSRYWEEHRDSWLIIIGGEGTCYEEIQEYVKKSVGNEHIVLIKSMGNPIPVMKKCDVFVLSSLYDAVPMVFFEVEMLQLPIVSADIPATRTFMQQYGGYLTPSTPEGVYNGMVDFHNGKVHPLGIDFAEHNRKAVEAFENLYR